MADSKLTALPADATPTADDLVYLVNDPTGTPTSKKATLSNAVAGAGAVMESDTTTAAMSFVVDEDTMVSDLATMVPTQQSTKAYVDAHITDAADAHDASAISVLDSAGAYTGADVEAVLAELPETFAPWRFIPADVGGWYKNPLCSAENVYSRGLEVLVVHIFHSGPDGVTIDQFDHYINTAGAAGAVVRVGVWIVDDQTNPFAWVSGTQYATLQTDLGTVDCTTTGRKLLTPGAAVNIAANTWFGVGGVEQVATSVARVTGPASGASPFGVTNYAATYWSRATVSLRAAGVAAGLGNFTPNDTTDIDSGVGIHRSA